MAGERASAAWMRTATALARMVVTGPTMSRPSREEKSRVKTLVKMPRMSSGRWALKNFWILLAIHMMGMAGRTWV